MITIWNENAFSLMRDIGVCVLCFEKIVCFHFKRGIIKAYNSLNFFKTEL